jgi:murein endopeptidase
VPRRARSVAIAALAAAASLVASCGTSVPIPSRQPVADRAADAAPAWPERVATARKSPPFRQGSPRVRWRESHSLGSPSHGRLAHGVMLPVEGRDFFTWDPIRNRTPNRAWRRWANDDVIRVVLRVLRQYRRAHPDDAPRVGIGDLSRPHGGDFSKRYGPPGHVSHQNGLDVDVYYPRIDRREWEAVPVSNVDRRLSQELVDRFVRAGARYAFVGFSTGLTGPPRIVQPLPNHNNHVHVRFSLPWILP